MIAPILGQTITYNFYDKDAVVTWTRPNVDNLAHGDLLRDRRVALLVRPLAVVPPHVNAVTARTLVLNVRIKVPETERRRRQDLLGRLPNELILVADIRDDAKPQAGFRICLLRLNVG